MCVWSRTFLELATVDNAIIIEESPRLWSGFNFSFFPPQDMHVTLQWAYIPGDKQLYLSHTHTPSDFCWRLVFL